MSTQLFQTAVNASRDPFKPGVMGRQLQMKLTEISRLDKNIRKQTNMHFQLKYQREQIARDLHDGIGSQLTHLISRLDLLAYNHKEMECQLAALRDFAHETVEQLRETIWVLHQPELTYGQLTERMRGLLTRISCDMDCPKIKITAYGESTALLAPQLATSLFRIMQEGVNNAIKYASSTNISVCLATDEKSLTLLISDDGKGFNVERAALGYGLLNIKRRAEELNGSFGITSSADGTDILVEFPL
ncbi:histidine kinase [Dyadobacter sp. CY107]|uniref:sensor histidine kinase n=1 Tax=Dyadobacter fanqingshengii TaxID=2906443 RepID=UPI001F48BED6|nr:histidine kinase [Dyadobacter fanqingshengii]MCF2502705.1 histidine kinase [Dyadobacter fanqingshengii]